MVPGSEFPYSRIMSTWIALFRGINVGGNNILPMKDLKADLEDLKLEAVKTYIQSGNVVFRSKSKSPKALAAKISARVEARHGFKPKVFLLSIADLEDAMRSNPFPEGESEPKTLHLGFLSSKATAPNLDAMKAAMSKSERFRLTDTVFYLHAPDGIGRSKLAAGAEKWLGVSVTGRNWRTVQKLVDMARSD